MLEVPGYLDNAGAGGGVPVALDVQEVEADRSIDRAGQVGEEHERTLENTDQVQGRVIRPREAVFRDSLSEIRYSGLNVWRAE